MMAGGLTGKRSISSLMMCATIIVPKHANWNAARLWMRRNIIFWGTGMLSRIVLPCTASSTPTKRLTTLKLRPSIWRASTSLTPWRNKRMCSRQRVLWKLALEVMSLVRNFMLTGWRFWTIGNRHAGKERRPLRPYSKLTLPDFKGELWRKTSKNMSKWWKLFEWITQHLTRLLINGK